MPASVHRRAVGQGGLGSSATQLMRAVRRLLRRRIANMAILETTQARLFPRGFTRLELTPNMPQPRERVDTYTVRLWIHDQIVYDRVHSVRDWQMRHYYVEMIAHAFINARVFLGREIAYSPETKIAPRYGSVPTSPACAHLDAGWITVVVFASTTKQHGDLVQVNLYLQNARTLVGNMENRSRGDWGEYADMTWGIVLCRPDEAEHFGRQLRAEIDTAEAQRVELDIPEYDDPRFAE